MLLVALNNKEEKILKTYRVIPLVFILFLFGFTLITVSPVFAQDNIDMSQVGEIRDSVASLGTCYTPEQCGDDVDKLEDRIAELEAHVEAILTNLQSRFGGVAKP